MQGYTDAALNLIPAPIRRNPRYTGLTSAAIAAATGIANGYRRWQELDPRTQQNIRDAAESVQSTVNELISSYKSHAPLRPSQSTANRLARGPVDRPSVVVNVAPSIPPGPVAMTPRNKGGRSSRVRSKSWSMKRRSFRRSGRSFRRKFRSTRRRSYSRRYKSRRSANSSVRSAPLFSTRAGQFKTFRGALIADDHHPVDRGFQIKRAINYRRYKNSVRRVNRPHSGHSFRKLNVGVGSHVDHF